ncbi:carbohydate-binding domain-containing protein [Massilia sp. Se16.2.3]|uniref:carbohydate-binding domain-containing protein n=1 Tax=Massilia sp. Se16.2.3 TaxID=2709303 RepID=UPI001E318550|nr:carbohydate-binding domain-containing protein [Massilia sp. Se16.2.3]
MPTRSPVSIEWECLANGVRENTFAARLALRNEGEAPIAAGWQLYFNTCRKVLADTVSPAFLIEHVNGDLFRLTLRERAPWQAGEEFDIRYEARFWAISITDAPLGFYLVTGEGEAIDLGDPHIVPFTRAAQRARHSEDRVPTNDAARRFDDNAGLRLLPIEEVGRITPQPLASRFTDASCRIGSDSPLLHEAALAGEAAFLRTLLAGLAPGGAGVRITLETGPVDVGQGVPEEAYRLDIALDQIRLRGASAHGVFNGLQTLRQLIEADGSVPLGGRSSTHRALATAA